MNSIAGKTMTIQLTSNTFKENAFIPIKYTCDGEDISPDLHWKNIPEHTKSIAIICDDPDAPMKTWVHWVVYNIPPTIHSLEPELPPNEILNNGIQQGINDFRKIGYGGPCPPGGIHRYYFKIYALDTKLSIKGNVTKETLLKAMDGHVLAEGVLMGRYQR